MSDFELAAPCGLYCGVCTRYRAIGEPDLAEKLARAMGKSVEAVKCRGCRAEKGLPGGDPICATWACVQRKRVEFCYECADFPCLLLSPCADRAGEIPHNMKIYNLLLIQKKGVPALAEQSRDISRRYFRGKKVHGGNAPQL